MASGPRLLPWEDHILQDGEDYEDLPSLVRHRLEEIFPYTLIGGRSCKDVFQRDVGLSPINEFRTEDSHSDSYSVGLTGRVHIRFGKDKVRVQRHTLCTRIRPLKRRYVFD